MAVRRTLICALSAGLALTLGGCVAQHRGAPDTWYAAHGGVKPRAQRVSVCHGFGCHLKTSVAFSPQDLTTMRRLVGARGTPAAERAGIARMIAWAEKRVATAVGSENDVGGLDLSNAGRRGQMDCIDEAANTTSYLTVAAEAGLLKHHTVARPVARGFFLDGRYPHATAVVTEADGTPFAVDSWPHRNGVKPDVMPLADWFAKSPAA